MGWGIDPTRRPSHQPITLKSMGQRPSLQRHNPFRHEGTKSWLIDYNRYTNPTLGASGAGHCGHGERGQVQISRCLLQSKPTIQIKPSHTSHPNRNHTPPIAAPAAPTKTTVSVMRCDDGYPGFNGSSRSMQYPIDASVNVERWVVGLAKSKQEHRGLRRSYKNRSIWACAAPTKAKTSRLAPLLQKPKHRGCSFSYTRSCHCALRCLLRWWRPRPAGAADALQRKQRQGF